MVAYAGILDGRSLWLALEPLPGAIALRDAAGVVHTLPSDLPEHDPSYRSVRVDLLALPGEEEQAYDVVVVPPDGRAPRTVWTPPLPRTPMRVPIAPGRAWQLDLARTEEGMLRVRRVRAARGVDVVAIALAEDGIRLSLAPVDDVPLELVALEDDAVVATFPVERDGDTLTTLITADGLPEGHDQLVRWGLGSADRWVPLRRMVNDLAKPNAAVLLPVLTVPGSDEHRLRLRYAPDGTLAARVVGLAAGEDEA